MKVMINSLTNSKNNLKINVNKFGNMEIISDLYYITK